MKKLLVILVAAFCGQVLNAQTVNLEKDNPETLIGVDASQFVIFGLSVNMTHEQVWQVLEDDPRVYGESFSRSNIYVYSARGNKRLLELIWREHETKMQQITVLADCNNYLSESFRRLSKSFRHRLSDTFDRDSEFRERFLGSYTRLHFNSEIDGMIYYYDNIGIEIIEYHFTYATAGNDFYSILFAFSGGG